MATELKPENIINEPSEPRKLETPEPRPRGKGEVLYTDEIFERGLKTGLELAKTQGSNKPPLELIPQPIIEPPKAEPIKKKSDIFGFGIEKWYI